MSDPYDNVQDKVSVLGPTLTFKGELSAEEDLLLKGRVEGSISSAPNIRIGEEGSVEGNIWAQHITAEGTVSGDLHATGAVTVKQSANVNGNIFSPTVSLIEGARFKGSIDMDMEATAAQAPHDSASSAPESHASEPENKQAAVGGT